MNIISRLKVLLASLDFSCCCWLAILLALLIVVVALCRYSPAFRSYCQNWIFPFVRRFVFMLVVGAILLRCLAFAACKFDSLNVVRRATLYFSEYHSSVPIILVLLAIALVCCIPGGPTQILKLSNRIKSFYGIELFPAQDPDVDAKHLLTIVSKEIAEIEVDNDKNTAHEFVSRYSRLINSLKQKKRHILQQHAGCVFATIKDTSIHTSLSTHFFDACLAQNDKQVFVRILPANTPHLMAQIEDLEIFCDLIPANLQSTVFVHIVLYANIMEMECEPFKENLATIAEVENRIRNRPNLRLFRYSVTVNNAVKPED